MSSDAISNLIEQAIVSGSKGSTKLHDIFYELDDKLGLNEKDSIIRDFFDCWADAINHDYAVYKSQNPNDWIAAAQELKVWYKQENVELSSRSIWHETLQKYT